MNQARKLKEGQKTKSIIRLDRQNKHGSLTYVIEYFEKVQNREKELKNINGGLVHHNRLIIKTLLLHILHHHL